MAERTCFLQLIPGGMSSGGTSRSQASPQKQDEHRSCEELQDLQRIAEALAASPVLSRADKLHLAQQLEFWFCTAHVVRNVQHLNDAVQAYLHGDQSGGAA